MKRKPKPVEIEIARYTYDEWMAEGKRRFGEDFEAWKFVCPVCKNVASVGDYRAYKERGATPDTATKECIGRYDGSPGTAFGKVRGAPCDYVLWGLFCLPGAYVTMEDGRTQNSFAFAEPAKEVAA